MKKIILDGTTHFVGNGAEMLRVYRKALTKGYWTLFTEAPAVSANGTYTVSFEETGEVSWDNFNKYL